MNKKGLSQVVTTVLIILLVLVAVILIWSFVRPTIDEAGDQLTTECLTIDLEAVSCVQLGPCLAEDEDGNSLCPHDVSVRRNTGSGTLSGLKFIFGDGDVVLDDDGTAGVPEELETITYSGLQVLEESSNNFNVAAVLEDDTICGPQRLAIDCE